MYIGAKGVSYPWSFVTNSARGSIETTTIGKTHLTLIILSYGEIWCKMNFILNGTRRSSNICYYFVFTDFHSINFRTPNIRLFFMNIHGYTINSKTFVNLAISKRWHRCWWRMLETKCVGDKFKILVTDLMTSRQHNDSFTNTLNRSPS